MTHDWLLVETLGSEPAVVAQGRRTKNLVPISAFLRRNPNLMAIQTAIGETVRAGSRPQQHHAEERPRDPHRGRPDVRRAHPRRARLDRPARHRAARASDSRTADLGPDQRHRDRHPGVAAQQRVGPRQRRPRTAGRSPRICRTATSTRARPRCCPWRSSPSPGTTFCSTWDVTDHRGEPITIGFVARVLEEDEDDGSRAADLPGDELAQRTGGRDRIPRLSRHSASSTGWPQPGVHRALVDLTHWTLLKWLDDPFPFFDWRARESGDPSCTPKTRRTWQE